MTAFSKQIYEVQLTWILQLKLLQYMNYVGTSENV